MLYCVDTHMLIWGIKQQCTPGQEDMIERAKSFIGHCQLKGHKLLIPSVVVAEMLVGLPLEAHGDFIRTLEQLFMVAPFDIGVSAVYSKMYIEQKGTIDLLTAAGVTKRKIKADFMIAATAVSRQCQSLYTGDVEIIRFAGPYIRVEEIKDIPLPAKTMGLFGDGPMPVPPE